MMRESQIVVANTNVIETGDSASKKRMPIDRSCLSLSQRNGSSNGKSSVCKFSHERKARLMGGEIHPPI